MIMKRSISENSTGVYSLMIKSNFIRNVTHEPLNCLVKYFLHNEKSICGGTKIQVYNLPVE